MYLRSHVKGLKERGYKGQLGLHHAARKWVCVVQPIWRLVGPQVSVFLLKLLLFLENF
jgi:hypothetical protein